MRLSVPLVLALALLSGCAAEPQDTAAPPTSAPTPSSPEPSASASPSPSSSATPAATTARAVYWLGATQEARGPRLYREFVRRPATADPVRDAVEAMLTLEPQDEDYDSLWAAGTTVREVRREGTVAVVDLSRQARTNGGGSAFEAMTLQQLVHTVTAADPSFEAVQLFVEGRPTETLWGSVDTSEPVSRASAVMTLGPVWIDLPDGGTLSGEFGGTAAVFEATVSWELRQGERVVQEGFSTATEGAPGRGEWKASLGDVPPGDYVLWAYESSAQDGSITWLDTKRVTVRP